MPNSFRPGWPVTVVVVACLGVLVSLGGWQVGRSGWKTALIAEIEQGLLSPPLELNADINVGDLEPYRPVTISGRLLGDPILLQGAHAERNRPGTMLMQVLRDEADQYWLVERGWIPDEAIADALSGFFGIDEFVKLTAVTRPMKGRGFFTPAADFRANRIYAEDAIELSREYGIALEELALVITSGLPAGPPWDGLPVMKPPSPSLPNNHAGYAVTWFGLACALLGVYVAFGLARAKESQF